MKYNVIVEGIKLEGLDRNEAIDTKVALTKLGVPTRTLEIVEKSDGLPEEEFWAVVKKVNWGKDHDYKRIIKWFLKNTDQDFAKRFRTRLSFLRCALENAMEKHIKHCEIDGTTNYFEGSDDGWSDMTHHVVGLGKTFYAKAMKDPSILKDLDYRESFGYGIPYDEDYKGL